jgi:nitroimidazol reductase NimA-like FMN-containing flavoprotein (pyridoxamine 5'-phosphate oxidase superfamily)
MLILELTKKECVEMLTRLSFGRLGCSRGNQPYVVPFNFAYHERHLYSFATLGQKIEWMRTNPLVCVEADEIVDHYCWASVVVQGRYEELPDTPEWSAERRVAYALLQRRAAWWEPACARETHRVAVEQLIPMYYRIHIDRVTGRRAKPDPVEAVARLEPATASRWKGWLKSHLRRTPPELAHLSRHANGGNAASGGDVMIAPPPGAMPPGVEIERAAGSGLVEGRRDGGSRRVA